MSITVLLLLVSFKLFRLTYATSCFYCYCSKLATCVHVYSALYMRTRVWCMSHRKQVICGTYEKGVLVWLTCVRSEKTRKLSGVLNVVLHSSQLPSLVTQV